MTKLYTINPLIWDESEAKTGSWKTECGRYTISLVDGQYQWWKEDGMRSIDSNSGSCRGVNEAVQACELHYQNEALSFLSEHDRTAILLLLANIREACGDNGVRMQDELVEYIRELKRKADQFDAEREGNVES